MAATAALAIIVIAGSTGPAESVGEPEEIEDQAAGVEGWA